jgi:tetratricopeptide (TPR) repeat protein
MGLILMEQKKYKQAVAELIKATELDDKMAPAFRQAGALLLHFKKWKEAVRFLKRAVELEPQKPVTQYNLGLAALNIQQYDVAQKAFSATVKLKPKNLNALIGLGISLLYKDKPAAAAAYLRKALRKNRRLWAFLPEHFDPLVKAGKLESAKVLLEELIRVRPRRVFRKNLKVIRQRLKRKKGN